ncbi:MAG: orotidine-5'-phosphate decarboxylase [Desulfobacterales bacterium]|nr:orotidine-5'-phosphate decarboxylase [Desulfobacterales bacterium]
MKQARDYIVFPLDVPTVTEARRFIRLLSDHVGMFKVGLELFISAGPKIVHYIHAAGAARVFLDLKLHDIPETVFRSMERIAQLKVSFATVHCGETQQMLASAVAAAGKNVSVLGVTVLTSVAPEDIQTAGYRQEYAADISRLVLKRAAAAKAAGCAGVVCSGQEVSAIKENLGREFIAVTPGIRPLSEDTTANDQKRVTTPAQAIENGSDYLVIGRPIRDALDPRQAALRIQREIGRSLTGLDTGWKR